MFSIAVAKSHPGLEMVCSKGEIYDDEVDGVDVIFEHHVGVYIATTQQPPVDFRV